MRKSDPGFTLVELMVAITAAAMVLAAALCFMLLGVRMEKRSYSTAENQQAVRIVLTMTEKLAASGSIDEIETVGESWTLYDAEDKALLQYLSADGSLRTGENILVSNIKAATAAFTENEKLFTLTLTTEYDNYSTTVYCRNNKIEEKIINYVELLNETKTSLGSSSARVSFLTTLCNQIGSTGYVIGSPEDDPDYFSEWYIQQKGGYFGHADWAGWNENTPWCACFISWAAAQNGGLDHSALTQSEHYFANVDTGMAVFKAAGEPGTWKETSPVPGDIVFLSWDGDDNPEHVGVVLHIDGGNIYTVEGNSSGKVTVNKYELNSDDIIGYGVFEWKAA